MKILKNGIKLEDENIQQIFLEYIDRLRDLGHKIKEPQDEDLDKIWFEIDKENYEDEQDLEHFVVDLIFKYLYIRAFDIEELKGNAIINAINNMMNQLVGDNNEIKSKDDITLDRIYAEIESCELKFDENGGIIL